MGPIQSGINQSLAILSLASAQDPQAQANRKATADTRAFNKFVKSEEKVPLGAGEESQKMFENLKENAIQSNLEAGRTKDLLNIKDTKSNYEQAIENAKKLGSAFGIDADEETVKKALNRNEKARAATTGEVSYKFNAFLNNNPYDIQYKAIQSLNKKLTENKTIKQNMDMMKSQLKEDN